jgi:hypothetical protein
MSTAEVVDKFRVNACQALPGDAVAKLERAMLSLESQQTLAPIAVLGEACASADRADADAIRTDDGQPRAAAQRPPAQAVHRA